MTLWQTFLWQTSNYCRTLKRKKKSGSLCLLESESLDWGVVALEKKESFYVTIGNPAFCLFLHLTGAHFRSELHHGGDVSQQKIKGRPIRTWEISGILRRTWSFFKYGLLLFLSVVYVVYCSVSVVIF